MYRDIPDELRSLIEPVVEDHGFELVDVRRQPGVGSRGLLRVMIDSEQGDGRVPVDVCAEVSREIGTQLDANEADRWKLSLGSVIAGPRSHVGSGRKTSRRHAVKKSSSRRGDPLDGRRRFKGILIEFMSGIAPRVSVDGREIEIPFDEVEKANKLYKFSRADFSAARQSGG